jgi:hypothetical protein
MTIKEKLNETHEYIQQYYGFGESFFIANMPYRLGVIHKIIKLYITEFPSHLSHVTKDHLSYLENAIDDCNKLSKEDNPNHFAQNNFLNGIKSDETYTYWLFTQFVDSQQNGFFNKPFDEY